MMWFSELVSLYKADNWAFLIVAAVLLVGTTVIVNALANFFRALLPKGMTPGDVAQVVRATLEVMEKKYKREGSMRV